MLKIVSTNAETSVTVDGPVVKPLCTKIAWLLLEPILNALVQPKSAQLWCFLEEVTSLKVWSVQGVF
jgi:hypothetical protein